MTLFSGMGAAFFVYPLPPPSVTGNQCENKFKKSGELDIHAYCEKYIYSAPQNCVHRPQKPPLFKILVCSTETVKMITS